ncbi:Glutathione-dependent formaldehyde-activating GFA (fragment) [Mesorhizobium metallidurans STM 2683]|uniref:Glutathione-dependent formaldehyde-activating GFA n=1 Tax=Mesorhizobium metallidurans STM 2683 TaxID=1297569 RepID=M5EVV5_9HYPH
MQLVEEPLGLAHPTLRASRSIASKESGHFLAAVNVRCDALSVDGEQHVRWYRSSDKVEGGF